MEPKDTIITLRLFPYILFSDGKEKDQDELGNLVEESDELFDNIRFTPKVAGKLQARFNKKTWLKGSGHHWKWAHEQSRYSDKIQQRSLVFYFQGWQHSSDVSGCRARKPYHIFSECRTTWGKWFEVSYQTLDHDKMDLSTYHKLAC